MCVCVCVLFIIFGILQYGGGRPSILQKVYLPIVDTDICRELYVDELQDHQICAGDIKEGGKDSCKVINFTIRYKQSSYTG